MKVSLRDLDINERHFYPNLALMKLSAFHKAKGDKVYLNFPLECPDITYVSCVFTWNAKKIVGVPGDAVVGGSGIDLKSELRPEIEHIMPDYSLYPGTDYSMGYTARGCFRKCGWCIVNEKEGGIKPWARIYEFWNRQYRKMVILDNNTLAAPNCKQTMEDLIAEEIEVDFNQGLDIRMVNETNIDYLRRLKAKILRFSFDDISSENIVKEKVRLLTESGIRSRKLSFYVLYGYDKEDHAIERMKILAGLNVNVYPMAYRGRDGKEPERQDIFHETIFWHGPYQNKVKFLRLMGRLK